MSEAAPKDWDAATYDRVSDPQVAWAGRVLERLPLAGDETVLDAGCGSGRVTQMLLERLPRGHVVAVDAAPSMVEQARAALGDRATVFQSDLQELTVPEPVDAVFSNAVFHWVPDHDLLFRRLHAALRPGGRLVAQCGGDGNVERFLAAAREVALEDPYSAHLAGWQGPWSFATAEQTRDRLHAAGFADVTTWLEPSPVHPPEPLEYLRTVCLGHHLAALPEPLRQPYAEAVLARCGTPLELDYVRLNIDARRPTHV
ncbi:MAG TPA: methyltransferase domain-containing protein [Thermoleophilaceae bacterium]|nr:methyltransferase domain-containing protein [Thermoleophilaceae bacterium]